MIEQSDKHYINYGLGATTDPLMYSDHIILLNIKNDLITKCPNL